MNAARVAQGQVTGFSILSSRAIDLAMIDKFHQNWNCSLIITRSSLTKLNGQMVWSASVWCSSHPILPRVVMSLADLTDVAHIRAFHPRSSRLRFKIVAMFVVFLLKRT